MYSARIAKARGKQVANTAWFIYNAGWIGGVFLLMTIPIMWGININQYRAWNLAFTTLSLFPIAYVLMQPMVQFYAASAGAAVGVLTRADTATYAKNAVFGWNHLVVGIVFWYGIVCFTLAVVPFHEAPVTFWYIAVASALLMLLNVYFNIDSKGRIVIFTTLYLLGVIVMALVMSQKSATDTITTGMKDWWSKDTPSHTEAAPTPFETAGELIGPVVIGRKAYKIDIGLGKCIFRVKNKNKIELVRQDGQDATDFWYRSKDGTPVEATFRTLPAADKRCRN